MKIAWSVLGVVFMVSMVGQAANRNFTGLSGADMNFSTASNWDVPPVDADNIYIAVTNINGFATSAGNPAIIDSGFSTPIATARLFSGSVATGTGMAYVEVASGGVFAATTVNIGNTNNAAFDGSLTIRSGGTLTNRFLSSGLLSIGGDTDGMVGEVFVKSGAILGHTALSLNTYGTLTFEFGPDSVTTFVTTMVNTPSQNILNGLLQVDLAALTTAGSYTLVDSSANLTLAGNLKTILDNNGGSISGTGNYTSTNFNVLNGGSIQWTLTTADSGRDLVLITAMPVQATVGLFFIGGK